MKHQNSSLPWNAKKLVLKVTNPQFASSVHCSILSLLSLLYSFWLDMKIILGWHVPFPLFAASWKMVRKTKHQMNNQMKFVILALLQIDGPTLKQLSYIDILIDINMPHLSIIIYLIFRHPWYHKFERTGTLTSVTLRTNSFGRYS